MSSKAYIACVDAEGGGRLFCSPADHSGGHGGPLFEGESVTSPRSAGLPNGAAWGISTDVKHRI
jgi:hypothetical protein